MIGIVLALLACVVAGCVVLAGRTSGNSEVAPRAEASLTDIRAMMASSSGLTVSVLGDSTGNTSDEWVGLWARALAAHRVVDLHLWDKERSRFFFQPYTYGANGPKVSIWNGSVAGSSAGQAIPDLNSLQPTRPDIVLLSFGHNQHPGTAASDSEDLVETIRNRWGSDVAIAVMLQNAATVPRSDRSARNVEEIRFWALGRGLPVIDVYSAFAKSPDLGALIVPDGLGVHPNAAGSQLWFETVWSALD
ncbi:SGNH/GDSL hydrolase family protein [Gordonia sp. OPL2]|uniref:SGNH/GDSL hydrolase family protein n=1 Tax=Gordonia sp. OPL2 TaxID=2486274 RepID=UPI0016552158|nr:SGNH/GDSL hydrolase family protein [Gordonia sp. OPL2]